MDSDDSMAVYIAVDRFKENHEEEISRLIDELPSICTGDDESLMISRAERSLERCIFVLDLYQEQPHLLDKAIPSYVERLLNYVRTSFHDDGDKRLLFYQSTHFLRQLIKVRGYKTFGRFLPHGHTDLIPVVGMLEKQRGLSANATDETTAAADISVAEYVLLIWLCMLCRIPFDLSRFDNTNAGDNNSTTTSRRIYNVLNACLLTRDQRREAAAYCLSVFVVRPDSVSAYLRPLVFDDILPFLAKVSREDGQEGSTSEYGASLDHVVSTRCLLLANVLKRVKRELIPFDWAKTILDNVLRSYSNVLGESKNILIRKLTTKIVVRTALTTLRPKVASWRYDRGSRSLAVIMAASGGNNTNHHNPSEIGGNGKEEEETEVGGTEEIESVINYLLTAAKDKDTICRWSAAKGFGRLCARLPRELADQVVSALLTFFTSDDLAAADASRHGACLSLAELGRRGLLLPARLPEVVPLVVRSLTFDEQRGIYSVGANVRDAACYVCWSFARAYAPAELRPYNLELAVGLLTTAIFDREVNCRRAASAAFQEHVGRQRGEFPHGIDLLTAVDYFAVGNRKRCYCELSRGVASFPEYGHPLIDHVVEQKIGHWDECVRDLASDALRVLTSVDPDYAVSSVIPKLIEIITHGSELFPCQGAVFSLGRIVAALRSLERDGDGGGGRLSIVATITELREIPIRLYQGRLFKGVGSELIRRALNDYIGNIASVITNEPDESTRVVTAYRAVLDDNLAHQKEDIREGAGRALEALLDAFHIDDQQIEDDYITQLEKAAYERQRSGAAFALSALPRRVLIGGNRAKILGVLTQFSMVAAGEDGKKSQRDFTWAIARRDALTALATVVEKIGLVDRRANNGGGLESEEVSSILECYARAMDDYTIDSRGDIGTLVRKEAISGVKRLFSLFLVNAANSDSGGLITMVNLNEDLCGRAVRKWLQQCCEKIDRTREFACQSMRSLIREAADGDRLSTVLHFPRPDVLKDVFGGGHSDDDDDWSKADLAYPKLIRLLDAGPVFAYPVLLGFAVTVGGLTESSVRSSSDALLSYIGEKTTAAAADQEGHDTTTLGLIVDTLTAIFSDHRKIDRVSIPLMKTIDRILSCNYLDDFLPPRTERGDDEEHGQEDALVRLLNLCIDETIRTKNSQKILVGLSVCGEFLRFEGSKAAPMSLQYSLRMLTHTYPRIRREAAARLYESIMAYFTLDNHSELALSLLSETDWDAADTNQLRECTDELKRLLKVA